MTTSLEIAREEGVQDLTQTWNELLIRMRLNVSIAPNKLVPVTTERVRFAVQFGKEICAQRFGVEHSSRVKKNSGRLVVLLFA